MEDWVHQFVFLPSSSLDVQLPENWKQIKVDKNDEYTCLHHRTLPFINAELNRQKVIFLGWPVDIKNQRLVADGDQLNMSLEDVGGRFIAYIPEKKLFQGDPLACQPAVVDFDVKALASTSYVIEELKLKRLEKNNSIAIDVSENNNLFYPFGLLPFNGQKRLTANHCYMLESNSVERSRLPEKKLLSISEAADITEDTVTSHINAFRKSGDSQIAISAGMETRLMLTCSLPFKDSIKYITRFDFDSSTEQDYITARYIAKKLELQHNPIVKKGTETISHQEKLNWLRRTGDCIGGNPLKSYYLIDSSLQPIYSITGIGGELTRGFYWSKLNHIEDKPSPSQLLHMADLPKTESFLIAAKNFLEELPSHYTKYQISDIFYLESRISCFSSPHKYGCIKGINFVYPFSSVKYINASFSLGDTLKKEEKLFPFIITGRSNFLGKIPYNKPINIKNYFKRYIIKRYLRNIKHRVLG